MMYDVAVIGGGVIGGFIARELCRWDLKVCILEAHSDVACGSSGANSGIVHGGFDPIPGTLKAQFNVEGCRMMAETTRQLDVPYKQTGSLVVAHNQRELDTLAELLERGRQNGLGDDLVLIKPDKLKIMEPYLASDIVGALFCPQSGIVCPYELTFAAIENALCNGAELYCDSPVTSISRCADQNFELTTPGQKVSARRIVNAAGICADQIYAMAIPLASDLPAAESGRFEIKPKIGEYMLLDKSQGHQVNRVMFRTPGPMGKGILVAPTVDGNLLLGPTSLPVEDRGDAGTTLDGNAQVRQGALMLVPDVNLREVITSFAGLRAASDHPNEDFIIGPSAVEGFYNAAGIESPGLTSAPAIGQFLADKIACDLAARPNSSFDPVRPPRLRFHLMDNAQKAAVIARDPTYGNVICRCETITEGEILDAIRRPCGAKTVDGVKRRTRAGMGRCQGGFCSPRVIDILARELGVSPLDIRKSTPDSYILTGLTKSADEKNI